jgi:D-ribose pyranose/furanose isomerase RbsD
VKTFTIVGASIAAILSQIPKVRQLVVSEYDKRVPQKISRVTLSRRFGHAEERLKQFRARRKNSK